jgi:hypothetical protein
MTLYPVNKEYINDSDVWGNCPVEHLWLYDKLILAKTLRYECGPAGIPVPKSGWYVVRPITNIRMMGCGASKMFIRKGEDIIPDGHFWTEFVEGRHISIDYKWGEQALTVEGIKEEGSLNKFVCWKKVNYPFRLNKPLKQIAETYKWFNIEIINNRIIEVHLRYNDDFVGHNKSIIYPVWKDGNIPQPEGTTFFENACGDRLGFWI